MKGTAARNPNSGENKTGMEKTVKTRVRRTSAWALQDPTDRPPQVLITQMNIPSTCWAWPPFHSSPRFRSRASRWDGLLSCCSSATRWAWITDLPVLKPGDEEVFEMMIFIQLLFRFFTPSLSFSSRADVLWIIAFYAGTCAGRTWQAGPLLFMWCTLISKRFFLSLLQSSLSSFGSSISPPLPKLIIMRPS